jgi:hypothetical protein
MPEVLEAKTLDADTLEPGDLPEHLEARQRALHQRVLSLICRSTGRRRTPEELRTLDELRRELHDVRAARRRALDRV